MVSKGIRCFVFPFLSFTCVVSVGFAAWVFNEQNTIDVPLTGSVYVTTMNDIGEIGELRINVGKNNTTVGDSYTTESQYYTLVFSEDMTLNEAIGIALEPDIEYTFSNYYPAEDGYAYYLSYNATATADSVYDKYVGVEGMTVTHHDGFSYNANGSYNYSASTTSTDYTYNYLGTETTSRTFSGLTITGTSKGIHQGTTTGDLTVSSLGTSTVTVDGTTYDHQASLVLNNVTYTGYFNDSSTLSDVVIIDSIGTDSTTNLKSGSGSRTISMIAYDEPTTNAGVTYFSISFNYTYEESSTTSGTYTHTYTESVSVSFGKPDTSYSSETEEIRLDLSEGTPVEDHPEHYTATQTLIPNFVWKSGMKPKTEEAYNAFIEEVSTADPGTFEIVLTVTYKEISSTTTP